MEVEWITTNAMAVHAWSEPHWWCDVAGLNLERAVPCTIVEAAVPWVLALRVGRMNRGQVTVAAMVAAGLLVSGCGSPEAPGPLAVGDGSRVDMCAVLTDAELSARDIDLSSRETGDELGIVGCRWIGHPITLRLERDEDPVAVYRERRRRDDPAFTSFRENTVHGRAGVQLSVEGTPNNDCVQLMDGGPVSLSVAVARAYSRERVPLDVCAEALRIAELIAPRLP